MGNARRQIHKGRHVLTDFAGTVIERAPDVLESALEEIRRDGPRALEQAHDFVEKVASGSQDRFASHSPSAGTTLSNLADHGDALARQVRGAAEVRQHANAGLDQAKDLADHVQQRLGRHATKKPVRSVWRRRATFLMLAFGAGVVLNRVLRARSRTTGKEGSSATESGLPSATSGAVKESDPVTAYHTSVPDSGGEGGVYHDRQDCPAGQRIKPEHRVSGTDGRARCKDCELIAS
jgi:hypothetical protein